MLSQKILKKFFGKKKFKFSKFDNEVKNLKKNLKKI